MSTLSRVLEPEYMDTAEEAVAYDAMDFIEVNAAFTAAVSAVTPAGATVADLGCGPLRIAARIAAALPGATVFAVDAARHMLRVGATHAAQARVVPVQADCKRLPFAADSFDAVISNSLVHHIPDPAPMFAEIARIARPGAALLIRDLFRPRDAGELDRLVDAYAAQEAPMARRLFADSLHAALTLAEVSALVAAAGLEGCTLAATSDRHWTLSRPGRDSAG